MITPSLRQMTSFFLFYVFYATECLNTLLIKVCESHVWSMGLKPPFLQMFVSRRVKLGPCDYYAYFKCSRMLHSQLSINQKLAKVLVFLFKKLKNLLLSHLISSRDGVNRPLIHRTLDGPSSL